ncbi:hypothetical protein ACFPTR_08405 [Aliibacillus thermotolerans]|uniref:Type I-B CRISPR-associated protein Cas8b1/Cst1 n=1 Tax=Aliibacillus thermotolerans TaxID=1834418 RepID=A0ABW0U6W0_9BACI|nr:hypothetical protein [Aliibacillus thermotolerans]MDA3129374.1 hypothetical protein [Aliibacillus thermotolerans]
MQIELYAEDWLTSAGLVGLKRLFPDETENTPFGLKFDSEILEEVTERYFDYLLNNFSVAERQNKILTQALSRAERNPDTFKDIKKQVQRRMTEELKKVERYFPDIKETKELQETIEIVKKIKDKDDLPLLQEKKEVFIKILRMKQIHEKITLNFVKTVIMQPLFGQVSFLNVTHNKRSTEEHKEIMIKDYITPTILEIKWLDLLNEEEDIGALLTYLEENKDYKPFREWLRLFKKYDSVEQIKEYMEKEVPPCILFDNQYGTGNYEEMIFTPLGISLNKSLNFSWDLNKKQSVPLSALGRLILFMVPIGTAVYQRKIGFGAQSVYENFYGFLYSNDLFGDICQMNNQYKMKRLDENPFEEVIYDVLLESTEKAGKKQKKEMLLIEFHSNYESKKTLLDYYHMPNYVVDFFLQSGKTLRWIHLFDYREAFVRSILEGRDPKQVLFRYMREVIDSSRDGKNILMAVLERRRFLLLKKGVTDVKSNNKVVYHIFGQGQELRKALMGAQQVRESEAEGTYTASSDKKIRGLAYRLLNAAKARHKQNFLDTAYRMYLGVNLEIPTVLLNVLHEKNVDFETVSSAFISGLLSNEKLSEGEKEE